MKTFITLSAALWLSACATGAVDGDAQVAQAEPTGPQICVREEPTASRIPVTRCRTQSQIDQRRNEDRAFADKLYTHPTPTP